uniref:ANAPC4_WD40 domain-containing protein n=1 Tax=Heterorhabditis bacteriophora TaxID=37862 RepID=A0A1I7WW49_HETBA
MPFNADQLVTCSRDEKCEIDMGSGVLLEALKPHCTAANIVAFASTGSGFVVDIEKQCIALEVTGIIDKAQSLDWSEDGTLLAIGGNKGRQVNLEYFAIYTTKWGTPIHTQEFISTTGVLMPFYDMDTKLVFLAGKGTNKLFISELQTRVPYLSSVLLNVSFSRIEIFIVTYILKQGVQKLVVQHQNGYTDVMKLAEKENSHGQHSLIVEGNGRVMVRLLEELISNFTTDNTKKDEHISSVYQRELSDLDGEKSIRKSVPVPNTTDTSAQLKVLNNTNGLYILQHLYNLVVYLKHIHLNYEFSGWYHFSDYVSYHFLRCNVMAVEFQRAWRLSEKTLELLIFRVPRVKVCVGVQEILLSDVCNYALITTPTQRLAKRSDFSEPEIKDGEPSKQQVDIRFLSCNVLSPISVT